MAADTTEVESTGREGRCGRLSKTFTAPSESPWERCARISSAVQSEVAVAGLNDPWERAIQKRFASCRRPCTHRYNELCKYEFSHMMQNCGSRACRMIVGVLGFFTCLLFEGF